MNKSSLPQGVGRVFSTVPQVKTVQSTQPTVAPTMSLHLSLSQLTTLRWSLYDEILHLRSARYEGIGLWRPKVAKLGVHVTARLIRNAGLKVSSLSFAGGFTGTNGQSYLDAVADGRDAITDAAALGARNLIVVSGPRNGHTVTHGKRLLLGALTELADFAQTRGVKLCLLPMHRSFAPTWTSLNTLDAAVEVIDLVGHPSLSLAFNSYQLMQESRLVDRIPAIAGLTGLVQIADATRPPLSRYDQCLTGEGIVPVAEIVRSFQFSGFDGYYEVQVCSTTGGADDDSQTLSKCRDAILRLNDQAVTI